MRALVFALLAVTACGSTAGPGKATTPPAADGLRRYVDALRGDDARPAYELLSADLKAQISFEEFAARWKDSGAERQHQARALETALEADPSLGERSRVAIQGGKSVGLTRERGEWKLDSALVSRTHASRPHDAVAIFADALAARDYPALLNILTQRRREGIGKQVDMFVGSLQKNVTPETMVDLLGPDRAEVRWEEEGMTYRIILRKEGEEWRIDDVDMRPLPDSTAAEPEEESE